MSFEAIKSTYDTLIWNSYQRGYIREGTSHLVYALVGVIHRTDVSLSNAFVGYFSFTYSLLHRVVFVVLLGLVGM